MTLDYDYAGVFHLHSDYSYDGNTKIGEIIESAGRSKTDFIVINDHFNLDARKDGWGRWHGDVFVVAGSEISPRYNHYLAMGIEKPVVVEDSHNKPQQYIDIVNSQGGLGLIAHPDHNGAEKYNIEKYPWIDWSVKGYAGISIWDLMTDWQEQLGTATKALFAYIFPAWSLSGAKQVTLSRWDKLNESGKVCGYGEADNHNFIRKEYGIKFKIFPFDYALSTIRTHILTESPLSRESKAAEKQIFDAITNCRVYVSQERWNQAKGFKFKINSNSMCANIGGEIELKGQEADLMVELPRKGNIEVLCNGNKIKNDTGCSLKLKIKNPGIYRIEAQQKILGIYKPWIYSNPIWVK